MLNESVPPEFSGPIVPAQPAPVDSGLSALIRLRQIAEELKCAAKRDNLEVVKAAASLLGPTTEQFLRCHNQQPSTSVEVGLVAQEIHALLQECEAILTTSLRDVGLKMKRLGQGKRALAQARSRMLNQAPARLLV